MAVSNLARKGVSKDPAKRARQLANLKPYAKGENGHQHVYALANRLKHALDKPLVKPDAKSSVGDQLVYSTLQGALLREPTPFHEVWERIEGKLQDSKSGDTNIDARQIIINVTSDKAKELTSRILQGED